MGQPDRVAKLLFRTILSQWVVVQTQDEISLAPQSIEVRVCITPSSSLTEQVIESIGMLAKMLKEETIFEPYSTQMGSEDLDDITRRQLALQHDLEKQLEQQAGNKRRLKRPQTWVIAPEDAPLVRLGHGLLPSARFGYGVYEMAPEQCFGFIVLSQLPKTRETLALRLRDRGERLMDAIEEVLALDLQDPLLNHLLFVLIETKLIEVDPMTQSSRLSPEILKKIDQAIALRDQLLKAEAIRDVEQKLADALATAEAERVAKEQALASSEQAQRDRENAQRERESAQRERENAQRERENAQREREVALQRVAELEAKLAAQQPNGLGKTGSTPGDSSEPLFCVMIGLTTRTP